MKLAEIRQTTDCHFDYDVEYSVSSEHGLVLTVRDGEEVVKFRVLLTLEEIP